MMKGFKRFLCFLMALAMVITFMPLDGMRVYAGSTTSGACGATASDNVTWEVTKSSGSEVYDTLTIRGTGAMKDYTSNSENPTPWLEYTNSISKVVINDGVTTIGEYAFFCFYNLNSITIPNSVKTIGKGAVQFCPKLISITIPNSVTTIGGCAFGECSALTSITIPSGVTSISDEAFSGCTSLTSVEFKGTSTNVGGYAFVGVGTSGGTSNPTLTLPEGWTGTKAPTDNTTDWYGGYFAGSSSSTPVAKIGTTEYTSIDVAISAVTEGQTITLVSDIDLTSTINVSSDKNFTLDLNGHVLNGVKSSKDCLILNDGNLTIKDSNPSATHTDWNTSHPTSDGNADLSEITGGVLTGGRGSSYDYYYGGAINSTGSLSMEGCTITGNTAEGSGGAIYAGGTLSLYGTVITNNTSEGYGAISTRNNTTVNLYDCTITGNKAKFCGGIEVWHSKAGTLIYNIGGKTVIKDNYLSDGTTKNDLGIYSSGAINISKEKPLVEGSEIGVSGETYQYEGKFTNNGTADDVKYFFADTNGYGVKYNAEGYLEVVTAYTITKAAASNGSFTVSSASATAGTEITVTPTPATGYEVDTVKYNDGTNDVTVTNNDGYKFTMPAKNVTVTVTFKKASVINPTSVKVASAKVTLTKSGTTSQIKATVAPENATDKGLTYTSSNKKVATVDKNGVITAVANGTATITVKTTNGLKATVTVTVDIPVVTEKQKENNAIKLNAGLKVTQTGSKINVTWGKVSDADGYLVYAAACGKSVGDPVKTIKGASNVSYSFSKINGKDINTKKTSKVYVSAYKVSNGKKVVIGRSLTARVTGKDNATYTNAKSIKITSKTSLSLKVNKTSKITAKTVLENSKKKQLSNVYGKEFRYASSDTSVAKVSKDGTITAKKAGTCTIYVYSRNGFAQKIKVTVK